MKKDKGKKKPKICFISCAGGHFEEIRQLKDVEARYPHFYVVSKQKDTKAMDLGCKKYLVRNMRYERKIKVYINLIVTSIQQLFIYAKERPDIVITTGAGTAIPLCLYAKFFGKKLIYIESLARMDSVSKTGKLLYKRADLFIVQWEGLLEIVPKAVFGGWIF